MAGTARDQKSTIAAAGATGASHVGSAEQALAVGADTAEQSMAAAYQAPRDAKQRQVDGKKAEGEDRWEHRKHKRR